MAKYIVDLQEIYEDKSDIDEYLITTDTRAITNTFTRQPTVKSDTRVALNPSEKLDVSMQKIDRYLQQLKDVAFYNPLTNINTTISSEANQVFTAKVVKTFYDNYTETDGRAKAMADAYCWNFTSGALQQKISDAILKTTSDGSRFELTKLSETTVKKAHMLSVYDQYSNDVSNFTANVKDDRNAPVYIYGTTQTEPYKARPYLATNTSVKSAVSSTKASNLKMFTAAGTELSPEGLITAKEISSGNNYVEFMNNVSKVLVINSAREASSVNSGGILGGGLITFTWKGETGTPEYVFGGPSKDKVHVYQPKNFSVNYATTAGSADYATRSGHAVNADEATHATSADTADNADEATHATSADTADKATKADKADRATNADNADEAAHAAEANHATSADEATHATSADSANNANHATSADNATNSDTVNNHTVLKDVPSNAVFTDTNTWRDVIDSLSSTDTTKSLSANQGKVLNEKFSNYLPLSGGTIDGGIKIDTITPYGNNRTIGNEDKYFSWIYSLFIKTDNLRRLTSIAKVGARGGEFLDGYIKNMHIDTISNIDSSGKTTMAVGKSDISFTTLVSKTTSGSNTNIKENELSISGNAIKSYANSYSYNTSTGDKNSSEADAILNFSIDSSGATFGAKGSALVVKTASITSAPDTLGNIYFTNGIADLSNRSSCDRAVIACYTTTGWVDVPVVCVPFVDYSSGKWLWGCHLRVANENYSVGAWTEKSFTIYVKYIRL